MAPIWRILSLSSCSLVGLTTPFLIPAHAQQGRAQETPEATSRGETDAPQPSANAFEDIVVTANKREQNLNKVGLSISALSGDQLAAQRVVSVADLARATPGMTFAPTPNSTPVYTIRGVGFYESSLAAYPDVSLYIDQAPLPLCP